MNILNQVKAFVTGFKAAIDLEKEIKSLRKARAVSGFESVHIGNSKDGGYPIFIADEFVFVQTRTRNLPQALAVSLKCGTKEIYVTTQFTLLPVELRDAIITHEVGHLKLDAIYDNIDRILANLGLSNKSFVCECAADDYSVASGYNMLNALLYLRDKCGYFGKELDKRIARLSK